MMDKDYVFLADPPSTGMIISMTTIAMAGALGLPFMVWLVFDGIINHIWGLVALALFSGLIFAGMLQSWKGVRSALRQRRDAKRHSISISNRKFVYRKDDLVQEILLADILNVEDRVEPSVGSQARFVKITYRKPDDSHSEISINGMDFSKSWEKQGTFGALLSEALRADQE
jgi:hypothetical protein